MGVAETTVVELERTPRARAHGKTKTERSRRTLALPAAAVQALRAWSGSQAGERLAAGDAWQDTGLVFTTHRAPRWTRGNVRKMFKRVCEAAGVGDGWTPRELRTSFVSLLSHRGVSIEEIARLVGHASTSTTRLSTGRVVHPGRFTMPSWRSMPRMSSPNQPSLILPPVTV
jgi:site-specific recombinase XerD